jgi:hypothetical protein
MVSLLKHSKEDREIIKARLKESSKAIDESYFKRLSIIITGLGLVVCGLFANYHTLK